MYQIILITTILCLVYKYIYRRKENIGNTHFLNKLRFVENDLLMEQNKNYYKQYLNLRKLKENKNDYKNYQQKTRIKLPVVNHDNPFSWIYQLR